jgi:hypothetical protein
MGAPNHYSRDIAIRCQSLIDHLLPRIAEGLPEDARFGGPLRTTFLLAMATPMIVLPIERMFKPGAPQATQAGDDRELDPVLTDKLADALGSTRTFGEAPFAATSRWSYVQGYPLFNVADYWPQDLLGSLHTPHAHEAAQKAPARRILIDLRNALAHGGVTYLGEDGRNTSDQAAMFAFTATRKVGQTISLNVLRVHEDDFCAFLSAWTEWLDHTPIPNVLDKQGPLAA